MSELSEFEREAYNLLIEGELAYYEKRIPTLKDASDRWRMRVAVQKIREDVKFLGLKL